MHNTAQCLLTDTELTELIVKNYQYHCTENKFMTK